MPAPPREQHHLLVARVLRDRPHLHVVGNHNVVLVQLPAQNVSDDCCLNPIPFAFPTHINSRDLPVSALEANLQQEARQWP
jgi:hypothetical protein